MIDQAIHEKLREIFRTRLSDLDVALAEIGWREVVEQDPPAAISALLEEQGRAVISTPILDDVVLAQLPVTNTRRAMVYPAGTTQILLGDPAPLDEVVVPGLTDFAAVPVAALTTIPLSGFARGSGWHVVTDLDVTPYPRFGTEEQIWQAAAVGRNALTAEIIGVCESALTLAGDHGAEEDALAHAEAEIAAARAGLDAALDGRSGWAASLAKGRAGRTQAALSALLATVEAPEVDAYRHVARAACLDLLMGDHHEHVERMGRALLRAEVGVLPVVEV